MIGYSNTNIATEYSKTCQTFSYY